MLVIQNVMIKQSRTSELTPIKSKLPPSLRRKPVTNDLVTPSAGTPHQFPNH